MSRSPSRLDRGEHPPMSRAIRQLMTRRGKSGMDLVRGLAERGIGSQSSVARYYSDREPDYQMAGHVEDVLGVPRGTLFSLSGYVPVAVMVDSLSAVVNDETLTERQRSTLVTRLLDSLRHDAPIKADALTAVLGDPRLIEKDRALFAELIQSFREMNNLTDEKPAKPSRRAAARR